MTSSSFDDADNGTRELLVRGGVPLAGEPPCAHVLEAWSDSESLRSSYWRADQTGLWRLRSNTDGSLATGTDAQQLIPGPIGVESRWEWEVAHDNDVQLRAREALQPFQHALRHVSELVALDEEITVPAGTFRTLHIRTTVTAHAFQLDDWFAPGIGLVKSLRVVGTGALANRDTRELLRYTIGAKPAFDPAAVLQAALAPDHDHKVTWLPPSPHVHGRFAVVRAATGSPACWFVAQQAHRVAAEDPAAWQPVLAALLADAPQFTLALPERTPTANRREQTAALATLIAELEAGRRELQAGPIVAANSKVAEHSSETTATVTLHASDGDGNIYALTATARIRDGVVRTAAIACKAAAKDPPDSGR